MTRQQKAERQQAIDRLQQHLKPGDTVYTILRSVSRSGMSRSICPAIKTADGDLWTPWGDVAKAIGAPLDHTRGGVKMGGCGMDMGFALVYELSHALHPEGFGCIGEGCPSNDHSNWDRDFTPYWHPHIPSPEQIAGGRGTPKGNYSDTHWHADGGYALRHRWL